MRANEKQTIHSGRLRKDIHLPNTAKYQLICFIAAQLSSWRDDPERPYTETETILTSQLRAYLNEVARNSEGWSHIQFGVENADETNRGRKIDLSPSPSGVVLIIQKRHHSCYDTIFPIECKRLPTPKSKDRDQREYVFSQYNTTGGIQRFKYGHHGANHNFGAMIAYIQDKPFTHWNTKINTWIDELSKSEGSPWEMSDHLHLVKEMKTKRTCQLKSQHSRIKNLPDIELHHLWVQIN